MKANCDICGTPIEIHMCCSGYMCGCMGMPTEPPVCSEECMVKWEEKIDKQNDVNNHELDLDFLL